MFFLPDLDHAKKARENAIKTMVRTLKKPWVSGRLFLQQTKIHLSISGWWFGTLLLFSIIYGNNPSH
jgi:hypothetical protein